MCGYSIYMSVLKYAHRDSLLNWFLTNLINIQKNLKSSYKIYVTQLFIFSILYVGYLYIETTMHYKENN